jgi:hypothetical protein
MIVLNDANSVETREECTFQVVLGSPIEVDLFSFDLPTEDITYNTV